MQQFIKLIISISVLFSVASPVFVEAQNPRDLNFRKNSAKEGASRMARQFALSSQQAHILDSLNVKFEEHLYAANILVQKERSNVLKKLFLQRENDLKVLFTKEQFDAYIKFKQTKRKPLKVTREHGESKGFVF